MKQNQSFLKGVAYTSLSATAMAIIGFLAKVGHPYFSLPSLFFWRFFFAFILCFIFLAFVYNFSLQKVHQESRFFCKLQLAWEEIKKGWYLDNIKRNFIRSFFTILAQYSFFYYVQEDTLLNGMVLLNTGPLFIPILERVFLGHKIGKSTAISLGVSFVGVLCVLQPDSGIFSRLSLIGILSGLSQGISQVLFGMNVKKGKEDIGVLILLGSTALLSLFPYIFLHSPPVEVQKNIFWLIGFLALLGAVSVLNQLSRSQAYLHSRPSRLSPFLYLSVLLGGVLDWSFLSESPQVLSVIGASLVVLGGILKIYLRYKILQKKELPSGRDGKNP